MAPAGRGVADLAPQRRALHVGTEAVAAFVLGPFLVYSGATVVAPTWVRAGLVTSGVGCIVLDGWLLYRYVQERRARPPVPA